MDIIVDGHPDVVVRTRTINSRRRAIPKVRRVEGEEWNGMSGRVESLL